jgi:diguanylate cyclase (GGDEF)-like protein
MATEPLSAAQALLLLNSAPVGVITTDGQRLLWLNEQAEILTGLNAQGLIGQPLSRLPMWLARLFEQGCEDDHLCGEAGCEVRATMKHFDDGTLAMACFLVDASRARMLQSQISELERRVELLDTRDEVSGLLNQRGLSQILEAQVSRSRRYGNPLSLISLMIDDYGVTDEHKADVLVALGHLFNDRLRWADTVGRSATDEFILILPETDATAAATLVTKLGSEFSTLELPSGDTVALSVSLGTASWQEGDDPTRLLQRCRAAYAR